MNKGNDKKVRIKVRLSEEENEKLKRCAAACGAVSIGIDPPNFAKAKRPSHNPKRNFGKYLKHSTQSITVSKAVQNLSLLPLKYVKKSSA